MWSNILSNKSNISNQMQMSGLKWPYSIPLCSANFYFLLGVHICFCAAVISDWLWTDSRTTWRFLRFKSNLKLKAERNLVAFVIYFYLLLKLKKMHFKLFDGYRPRHIPTKQQFILVISFCLSHSLTDFFTNINDSVTLRCPSKPFFSKSTV